MRRLTQADLKLLRALQEDADTPHEQLAAKAHTSPSTVSRHIQKLKEAKVLLSNQARVNPDAFGLKITVYTLVKLGERRNGDTAVTTAAFERHISAMSNVVEWAGISGDWDYLLKFLVRDTLHYKRLQNEVRDLEIVANITSLVTLGSPQTKPTPIADQVDVT